jgi:hypothetical protein
MRWYTETAAPDGGEGPGSVPGEAGALYHLTEIIIIIYSRKGAIYILYIDIVYRYLYRYCIYMSYIDIEGIFARARFTSHRLTFSPSHSSHISHTKRDKRDKKARKEKEKKSSAKAASGP